MNAMMFGFGATLGADAANAAVGDMKVRSLSSCSPVSSMPRHIRSWVK